MVEKLIFMSWNTSTSLVSFHVWLLILVPEYLYTVVLQFFWVFLPSSSETLTDVWMFVNFIFYIQRLCSVSVVSLLIWAQSVFYFLSFKFRPNFQRLHHFLFLNCSVQSAAASLQSCTLSFLFVRLVSLFNISIIYSLLFFNCLLHHFTHI